MIFLIIKTLAEPDKVCGLLGCPSANIFGSPPLAQRLLIIPMLIHHMVNHHHWWLWLCHDWVWRYFCFADYRRHQWTKGPLVQGRSFCTWMDSKICPLAVSYQLLAKHGFFLKIFWWQHLSILSSSFLSLGSLRRPSFRSTTRPALDQQSCANHTARVVTNIHNDWTNWNSILIPYIIQLLKKYILTLARILWKWIGMSLSKRLQVKSESVLLDNPLKSPKFDFCFLEKTTSAGMFGEP